MDKLNKNCQGIKSIKLLPISCKKIIGRVVYFANTMLSDFLTPKEEYQQSVYFKLLDNGLYVDNIEITEMFRIREEQCDVLLFGWGGRSIVSNSMYNHLLEHFCRVIIDQAKINKNTFYVMTSDFVSNTMKEILRKSEKELPNIFLSIDIFGEYYRGLEIS